MHTVVDRCRRSSVSLLKENAVQVNRKRIAMRRLDNFVTVIKRCTKTFIKLIAVLTGLRFIVDQWSVNNLSLQCNNVQPLRDPFIDDHAQYAVNVTWLEQRHRLLTVVNRTLSKVLVVAYMRSGSTLVSHVFSADPNRTVYWFEPILPYVTKDTATYTSRVVTGYRRQTIDEVYPSSESIADLMDGLLNCRLDQLPIETFTHTFGAAEFTRPTFDCIYNGTGFVDGALSHCLHHIYNLCGALNEESTIRRCTTIINGLKSMKNLTGLTIDDLSTEMVDAINFLDHRFRGIMDGVKGPESILSVFLIYRRCIILLENVARERNCLEPIRQRCQYNTHRNIITVKVIRARLHNIEETIRRIPDLSVFHLMRDPRAVAYSRYDSKIEPWDDGVRMFEPLRQSRVDVVRMLCARMLADLRAKRRLEAIYPGAIETIRYEDFVLNPVSTTARMFRHANHVIDNAMLQKWLQKHIYHDDNRTDGSTYEIIRKNPISRTTRWRSVVNGTELEQMNEHCRILLDEMRYDI